MTAALHPASTFTIRPGQPSDIPAIVDLLNAYSQNVHQVDGFNINETETEWRTPTFNPATDTRVAFDGDRLVGYAEVWDDPPHVDPHCFMRVHPDVEGTGLGLELAQFAEERARQSITKAPAGTRVTIGHHFAKHGDYYPTLMEQCGMRHIRNFHRMRIELDGEIPEPVLPAGYTIRPINLDTEFLQMMHVVEDAFSDHWGHVERPFEDTEARWRNYLTDPDCDPSCWYLVMDGDTIAGVSVCWPMTPEDAKQAIVDTLGVPKTYRRQGLGLALLYHSFREMKAKGLARVTLGVDGDSLTGATRLYEKAGMKRMRQTLVYEKVLREGRDIRKQSVE